MIYFFRIKSKENGRLCLKKELKMKYKFEVIGEIVGKERPRVNMATGRVYTPNKTKDYEYLVQQYFRMQYQVIKLWKEE